MRKFTIVLLLVFGLTLVASAQQFDFAVGAAALSSKSAITSTGSFPIESLAGGGYPVISGDILFTKNLGVGGEVLWRGKQAVYGGFQPYRPILFDVNGIWAPELGSRRIAAELMGGIGMEDIRFYTNTYNCGYTGCTNYVSSKHLLGHVGGGIKFYLFHNIFFRPEAHAYFIRNNEEFSSGKVFRVGASIGYTFRPDQGP